MRKLGRFGVLAVAALALLGLGSQGSAPGADASETTVDLYWYPYTVAGFDETPQLVVESNSPPNNTKLSKPCYDCYITSVTPELEVDSDPGAGQNWIVANYTSAPPARLHHMVLFNHALTDPTCAGNSPFNTLGDRWFASGDERGSLTFPPGYGYYIPPNDGLATNYWITQVMIHNLSSQSQTFRLKMTFKYHPAADNLKPVRHLWLDQNNCDSSQYPVSAGYEDDHWVWTVGQAAGTVDDLEGKIFEIGGHVHDEGASVAATLMPLGSGTETLICASQGGYAAGSEFAPDHIASPNSPLPAHPADAVVVSNPDPGYLGHIEAMTACATSTIIKTGDMLHLHTQYNADAPIPDVMGIMGAWVYDNCPNLTNPTQADILDDGFPGDGIGDDYGDACDADADGDGVCNAGAQGPGGATCTGTDPDDDGDGYSEDAESGTPVCAGNVNDDNNPIDAGDTVTNDGCPAVGQAESACTGTVDDDGDTLVNDGCPSFGTYSEAQFNLGTGGMARCGAGNAVNPSPSWPSDFVSGGIPLSTDKVTILDLTSFVAPARRLDTVPGNANFNMRWDLVPGRGIFTNWININDLTALIAGPSGFPTMFGGARALNGATCTGS
jgi:hypothetical protein